MKPRATRTEWVVEYLARALMRKRPLWWTWSAHETRAAALRLGIERRRRQRWCDESDRSLRRRCRLAFLARYRVTSLRFHP